MISTVSLDIHVQLFASSIIGCLTVGLSVFHHRTAKTRGLVEDDE